MQELDTALMTMFTTAPAGVHNTLYTLVSGQMYKEIAKQKATMPYVVFHVISNIPEWNFCSDFEKVRIQFDLFSGNSSSQEVENMYDALKALYDWKELTVIGYSHIYMKRILSRLVWESVNMNWHYTCDYEIYLEETS